MGGFKVYPWGKKLGKKKSWSDSEIMKKLREGWHPYKKIVGKYMYIVLRKKQYTRSLGPYTEEGWARVCALEYNFARGIEKPSEGNQLESREDVDLQESRIRAGRRFYKILDDMRRDLEIERGRDKSFTCAHLDDRYCTRWKYSVESQLRSSIVEYHTFMLISIEEGIRTFKDEDGKEMYVYQVNPLYCASCHDYKRAMYWPPRAPTVAAASR